MKNGIFQKIFDVKFKDRQTTIQHDFGSWGFMDISSDLNINLMGLEIRKRAYSSSLGMLPHTLNLMDRIFHGYKILEAVLWNLELLQDEVPCFP